MDSNVIKKSKNKKKVIIISVFVFLLSLIGGTFAYLIFRMNFTNHVYTDYAECFDIDYSILNDDDTSNITGTLFPSADYSGGLYGKVSIKINDACNITGQAGLKLYVDAASSDTLKSTVSAHCEDPNSLITMTEYTTSSACSSAGYTWVTAGTAFKYAVFKDSTNLSNGYINTEGADIQILTPPDWTADDYDKDTDLTLINQTLSNFYVYLWLDGELAGNTYTSLPFSGYVHASVTQVE